MEFNSLKKEIEVADCILIGIGEEFSNDFFAKKNQIFQEKEIENPYEQILKKSQYNMQAEFKKMLYNKENKQEKNKIIEAYNKLEEIIHNKDYFVITLNTDGYILESALNRDKIVEPCGDYNFFQCKNKCSEELYNVDKILEKFQTVHEAEEAILQEKFRCPKCNEPFVFNNILAPNYNEERYLPDWINYTQWLQTTLKRNTIILEFGVGMTMPNVIRWPFEKICFFNQKAQIYRIHSKLYQLSEDLGKKGQGIKSSPVDFLLNEIV